MIEPQHRAQIIFQQRLVARLRVLAPRQLRKCQGALAQGLEYERSGSAARYQRVDRVVIMADFPRNAAGKTLKREMREPYWAGREQKI